MKDKSTFPVDNNKDESSAPKKPWSEPRVEIISHDNIQSGQAGPFLEATFTGFSPFTLYNS